jgi:hypothetical protein
MSVKAAMCPAEIFGEEKFKINRRAVCLNKENAAFGGALWFLPGGDHSGGWYRRWHVSNVGNRSDVHAAFQHPPTRCGAYRGVKIFHARVIARF